MVNEDLPDGVLADQDALDASSVGSLTFLGLCHSRSKWRSLSGGPQVY